MRTVVTITDNEGGVYVFSEKNHQVAFARYDPFLWVLPGEPEGSLLYTNTEDDEPATIRDPRPINLCDND